MAARELGVSEASVRRWIHSGVLPAVVVGPGRRYRIADVDLALVREKVATPAPRHAQQVTPAR